MKQEINREPNQEPLEGTGHRASMKDQLNTIRTIVELLDTPDGREKAEQVLIDHWNKIDADARAKAN